LPSFHAKYVVFLGQKISSFPLFFASSYKQITLEIRLFHENKYSPLLYTDDLKIHEDVFDLIGNDFLQIGRNEYKVIVAEIDEDRSTYVLYVEETSYKFES
jgi:hypothetical protein